MLRKGGVKIKTNNKFVNKSTYEKTVLQIEKMLNMPEFNRLLHAFGGYIPEGVPLQEKIKTLVGFSCVWDYRAKQRVASETGEQARWLVGTENITQEQADAAMKLAAKWGMVNQTKPEKKEYDYILILGGVIMSCLYRTRYAHELIQKYELKVREVVGLTGLRPIADSEKEATDTYLADAHTEFDLMKAAVQKEFRVSKLRKRAGKRREELNRSWMVEEYENSPSICLVAAPSSEPDVRRANTADTFQFWSELKNIGLGKRLLLVTSQIYVPYQHLEGVRILGLSGGHEIETLGFPKEWSAGLQGLQKTENYLQEIRSTLQAMERLDKSGGR